MKIGDYIYSLPLPLLKRFNAVSPFLITDMVFQCSFWTSRP